MYRPRVVILGAGYAGLCTAHRLQKLTKSSELEIIIIDKSNAHVNNISLHEVAVSNANSQDISYSLVPILNKSHLQFIKDTVLSIDPTTHKIKLTQQELDYDVLVIALGFVPETFGISGMDTYAFQISSIDESETIARHIEDSFRKYSFSDFSEKNPKDLSIVIGGSGFTGIELLGELTDRLPLLCKKYHIDPTLVSLVCASADKDLLPMFTRSEATYIKNYLEKKGVQFYLNTKILGAEKDCFLIQKPSQSPEKVYGHTLIWTGGVSGHPIMHKTFGERVRRGRIIVDSYLNVPDDSNIYVLGDCAAFIAKENQPPEPTTAQIATQMGYHTANNLVRRLHHRPEKPFKYKYRGTVCSLGAKNALAHFGGFTITGFLAMRLKRLIETITDYKISGAYNAIKKTRLFKLINF